MEPARNAFDEQAIVMTSHMGPSEFSGLYECYHETVYRAALRITGNPADAEDVLQTVFLRVLNRSGRTEPAQMAGAYFRRAAVNAAVDLLRRRISHGESGLEASRHAAAERPVLLKEQLRRALATLAPDDAAMFLLRHVEGLTNGELAEMFGQEKNNVAVRLHRIRQLLQTEMER